MSPDKYKAELAKLKQDNQKLQEVVRELEDRNKFLRKQTEDRPYNQVAYGKDTASEVRRPNLREKSMRDIAQAHDLIESANFQLNTAKELIEYLNKNPELEKLMNLLNR